MGKRVIQGYDGTTNDDEKWGVCLAGWKDASVRGGLDRNTGYVIFVCFSKRKKKEKENRVKRVVFNNTSR